MSSLTDSVVAGDFLQSEVDRNISRKNVTVVAVAALKAGQVLGQKTTTTATVAAGGSNTGNGTMGTVTVGSKAKTGVYTLTCIAAASNAGTFRVLTPDGVSLPNLTVAAAYATNHISMTLADGSTDFVVGDTFTITLAGDNKYYPCVETATDGTQHASAILIDPLPITTGAVVPVIKKLACVVSSSLTWGATYDTDDKKNAALAELSNLYNIETVAGV